MSDKKVFAECRGLGITWDIPQWREFLKEHSSTDKAYSIGKYDYNYNDCCMNPDKEMLYQFKYGFLEIALSAGKNNKFAWGVNYSAQSNGCGGGYAANLKNAKFDSKEDAIIDCIKWYIPILKRALEILTPFEMDIDDDGREHEIDNRSKINAYKKAIADLEGRTQGYQLTLF